MSAGTWMSTYSPAPQTAPTARPVTPASPRATVNAAVRMAALYNTKPSAGARKWSSVFSARRVTSPKANRTGESARIRTRTTSRSAAAPVKPGKTTTTSQGANTTSASAARPHASTMSEPTAEANRQSAARRSLRQRAGEDRDQRGAERTTRQEAEDRIGQPKGRHVEVVVERGAELGTNGDVTRQPDQAAGDEGAREDDRRP